MSARSRAHFHEVGFVGFRGTDRLHTVANEDISCPKCGVAGRSVPVSTPTHLATPLASGEALLAPRYCRTEKCEVVYFAGSGPKAVILHEAMRVPAFHKDTDPARPVCYCFGYSVQDVLAAEDVTGSDNTVIAAITKACRQGLDRCAETNPEGRCCLGNVRAVAKRGSLSDCTTCSP